MLLWPIPSLIVSLDQWDLFLVALERRSSIGHRGRILQVCPHPWILLPGTVLTVSYIFIAQRELTVSIAFTAISLFSMVRQPLNVIPTFVSG